MTVPTVGHRQKPTRKAINKRVERDKRRSRGLCIDCGATAIPGHSYCGYCDEVKESKLAALIPRKCVPGRCYRCGKETTPGYKSCANCRAWDSIRHKEAV